MDIDLACYSGSWPIGTALRFKLDAPLQQKYAYLRGTRVTVLSAPRLRKRTDGRIGWAVCQKIFSYAFGGSGWAEPHFLEVPDPAREPSDGLEQRKVEEPDLP